MSVPMSIGLINVLYNHNDLILAQIVLMKDKITASR